MKLTPHFKQSCILCEGKGVFCVCQGCAKGLEQKTLRCPLCGLEVEQKGDICGRCISKPPRFSRAHVLYSFERSVTHLIHQFKYEKKLCVGSFFADKIKKYIENHLDDTTVVVPTPLHSKRLQERGFNPLLELLRDVKKSGCNTIAPRLVTRKINTPAFIHHSPQERARLIRKAFVLHSPPPKRVLLFDDVMTTTSTLNELANTLISADPDICCEVLVVARTEKGAKKNL